MILSAGAIGSPHLLLLSGIGPRQELEAHGLPCLADAPDVGKHLKDHLMCPLIYPAPGIGVPMNEVTLAMGPDALRAPAGPLPADPADDANLSPELQALKQEAERRFAEWQTTGRGLGASSLADAVVFCSSGLGDLQRHDTEIICFMTGGNDDFLRTIMNIDTARFFDDARQTHGARRGKPAAARQSGIAAQRGRNRSGKRRSGGPPGHPDELLRRPARHEGHGGGDPPGDGDRRALAGKPQARRG